MTERQFQRRAQRRLAILQHADEITGNASATGRLTTGLSVGSNQLAIQ